MSHSTEERRNPASRGAGLRGLSDRVRADPGSTTRADLIAAGRKLFARRGFDGTSIRAITGEADANLGAVTYHFGSKRELYSAVLEEGLRPMAARVRAAAESEGTALERVLAIVRAYFEHLEAHPDLPHLLLQEIAAGKKPPDIVLETIGGARAAIARVQREGVEDGSMRAGDPALTAVSIVSQPIFLTLVAPLLRAIDGVDVTDGSTRRRAVEHCLTFVRSALSPSPAAEAANAQNKRSKKR